MTQETGSRRRLVYGVTVGSSAFTLLRGQLAWLRGRGWDITLVASPDEEARKTADREGVRFRGIAMSRRISPLADLTSLLKWVSFLRTTKPDVINASTPKAGLLGHLAAWMTRVPRRVYVVRGLRLEGSRGLVANVLWVMERLSILLASDVVFVSSSLAAEAHRRRLIKPGAAWIIGEGSSNGIDSEGVARRIAGVDREELRGGLGLPPEAFVVGFVGRLVTDKGVDTLVRAFSEPGMDPKARLLLIGPLEEPGLHESIVGLGDRAVWLPWVDDVWGHLPAMDVLCLPSRREGLPTVVLEAAAAGIPAVVSRATGAVESVIDGTTGILIDVGDHRGLVRAVNGLASDTVLLRELGRAARERAVRSFAQERIWQGLHGILSGTVDPALVRRI